MKIALLTCENSRLNYTRPTLIAELAKSVSLQLLWDDASIDWSDFDYLVFRNTWDYFEKENEFNLGLIK
jgi:hypothetical protein